LSAMTVSGDRLVGLIRKESLQVVRDPSSILIAFVLPVVLLLLFAFAVSLDLEDLSVGVVIENTGADTADLAAAFDATMWLDVTFARDRRELVPRINDGTLRGLIVIPQDFDARLQFGGETSVQVITDGSQPNTANFVANYTEGVIANWLAGQGGRQAASAVALEPRFWFNPELESRKVIVPGSIAVVMTMIGTLLTALVVAREWERGTMEAIMSTPASIVEILAAKLLPYFLLGLGATFLCAGLATTVFGVSLGGSWAALAILGSAFLVPALGQGLLISALSRNQFVAAQIAMFSGFLPAFLLSGLLFEIASMPVPIQMLTYVVPARYFVSSLQTLFLAGDVWSQFLPAIAAMLGIGLVFFAITAANTRKRLD